MATNVTPVASEHIRLRAAPVEGPMATAVPAAQDALSYARGGAQPALLETTIGANLATIANAFADRDALVDVPSGRRWNYAELLADVRRLATGLLHAGIGTGDRVGIWAPTVPNGC